MHSPSFPTFKSLSHPSCHLSYPPFMSILHSIFPPSSLPSSFPPFASRPQSLHHIPSSFLPPFKTSSFALPSFPHAFISSCNHSFPSSSFPFILSFPPSCVFILSPLPSFPPSFTSHSAIFPSSPQSRLPPSSLPSSLHPFLPSFTASFLQEHRGGPAKVSGFNNLKKERKNGGLKEARGCLMYAPPQKASSKL